jgi:putative endopeptidase
MQQKLNRMITAAMILLSFTLAFMAQSNGFDTANMDRDTAPCKDFYQYANGTWLNNTEIPATEPRWGSFNILTENNNEILRSVLEAAAKSPGKKGSDTQLIGDFYSTCMDEEAIERAGTKPIDGFLKAIAAVRTTADLQRQIAALHDSGVPAVFSFGAGPDLKDSNAVIISAFQSGLSLPNRTYYTNTDDKSVETREKFVAHMTNMFQLLGDNEAEARANAAVVMAIQTRLANASLAPVELRNPDNRYNKVLMADAQKLTPNISWDQYFKLRGVPATEKEMNIAPAAFFEEANRMLAEVPVEQWKTYLRWMTVNNAARLLPKAFADENFDFYGRYLTGQKEQPERWKTCVRTTNGNLGEALGMEFARRRFKPEAKARMNGLIDNLMAAMRSRIDSLDWMSADTKKQAQAKDRLSGCPSGLQGIDRRSVVLCRQRSSFKPVPAQA